MSAPLVFKGQVIKKEWLVPPQTNELYESFKFSIPVFTKNELKKNKAVIRSYKRGLADSFKKEGVRADVILYGSQLYFPSLSRDFDLMIFYEGQKDAIKINKILGNPVEPALYSSITEKPFVLFRLNRRWKKVVVSAGLVSRKSLEKALDADFNVPHFCIRVKNPPKPSLKRICCFDDKKVWFPVKNKERKLRSKKYWLRSYPSWLLSSGKRVPASTPFYFEQFLSGEIIYSSNKKRLLSNLSLVLRLSKAAFSQFNNETKTGCFDNIFVRKKVYPRWFYKKLTKKLRELEKHDCKVL